VRDGRFREDLFYRLSIVRLHLPPLRERRVEIPTLANHYLHKHAQEYRKGDLRLSEDTMEYLMLYRWPGNVRQLANEMRRLAALSETSAVLMPEHLSSEITASRRTVPASERVLAPTEVVVRLDQPMAAAVRHLEQTMVQYALKKCEGRIEDTARMLGLSRKGLYLKRQRFGIEPPESSSPSAPVPEAPAAPFSQNLYFQSRSRPLTVRGGNRGQRTASGAHEWSIFTSLTMTIRAGGDGRCRVRSRATVWAPPMCRSASTTSALTAASSSSASGP
jgi:hypothetical protein